jgi:hypothetical protein
MNLAREAYVQLYSKEPQHQLVLKYHGRLQGFNATVKKSATTIAFNLSRRFENTEPEIQIGVMQFLLNKLNKTKIHSDNINLYHSFLKKMSDIAPVTMSDPILEASFKRCNEAYFGGMLSQPNLVWGRHSVSLLGTYTYATDTIMISSAMTEDPHLLDYIMHHEMLHKKHKFNHSVSRTHSHTPAFKADEAKFEDKMAEAKLRAYLRQRKPAKLKKILVKQTFMQKIMGWT